MVYNQTPGQMALFNAEDHSNTNIPQQQNIGGRCLNGEPISGPIRGPIGGTIFLEGLWGAYWGAY